MDRTMQDCAICLHFAEEPRAATGSVGLITRVPILLESALDTLGQSAEGHHVVVPACPEHVVDVYRERVSGVRMAWRLGEAAAILPRQSPAAVSASQA